MKATRKRDLTLKGRRIALGLTQERLAELVGASSYVSVGQWERGLHAPTGPARMLLAQALGVSLEVVNSWFESKASAA